MPAMSLTGWTGSSLLNQWAHRLPLRTLGIVRESLVVLTLREPMELSRSPCHSQRHSFNRNLLSPLKALEYTGPFESGDSHQTFKKYFLINYLPSIFPMFIFWDSYYFNWPPELSLRIIFFLFFHFLFCCSLKMSLTVFQPHDQISYFSQPI